MPTITVDGQDVRVDDGATVIQAAEKLGIYIPRYCYHPGLSIAGSCRMCLVEIENLPKLQIACYTRVQEGMKVTTTSEKVLHGRRSMLEFLLTDHPLDCPVCDQSGECDLQNFYMEHGRYQSRFLENKIKGKKAFPIGPHVMLDQERCILCTRCTRFTEEVTATHELGVFNRGDRSVIDLYPERLLENPYSGNVIDICPVGALTEREFRFRCRVWYLSSEESVCNGCARGCNINIHFNISRAYKAGGRRVMRLKPRYNPEVNQWWMCDAGRFGFEFIDCERTEFPYERTQDRLEISDWPSVLRKAAEKLRTTIEIFGPESVGVIASPQLANEELYACKQLFQQELGVEKIAFRNPWEEPGFEDDFLIKADKNPNTRGAEEVGIAADAGRILEEASSGTVKVLVVFWHDLSAPEAREALEKAEYVIFIGPNWNSTAERADLVLASATHAEKQGTFTNFEGRIQRFEQALLPLEDSKSDLEILNALAGNLDCAIAGSPEEAFAAWQDSSYEELDEYGTLVSQSPVGA